MPPAPKQPHHFRDKSNPNPPRYWINSIHRNERGSAVVMMSCRSLGWGLVGRLTPTDQQAADLEVINVKVALDLITPLMVTLWTWNQTERCRALLLSSGSFQRPSCQRSHWQTFPSWLLDDKIAGKSFGTLGLADTITVVAVVTFPMVQTCWVTCHHPCWCKYKRDFILFIRACVI